MAAAAPNIAYKIKKLVPMFNRVLIKRPEPVSQTKGGIVLPEDSKKRITRGTVVAVGPGSRTESGHQVPMSVRVGDEVLLADYGGTKVELEGSEYFLFRENEILAKIYD